MMRLVLMRSPVLSNMGRDSIKIHDSFEWTDTEHGIDAVVAEDKHDLKTVFAV